MPKSSAKDDLTRKWLAQHQMADASELIRANEELEAKVTKLQSETEDLRNRNHRLQSDHEKNKDVLRNNNKHFNGEIYY